MNQKKLVLLVEDDENHMILGRLLLERLGFKVETCENGQDAILLFSKSPETFYFVLTDYTMAPMDGLELAAELIKIFPATPILLCTGRDDPEIIKKAKNIGIHKIALKPSNRQEMEDFLASAGLYQYPD